MANSPAPFSGGLALGLSLQKRFQGGDRRGIFLQTQQQRAVGQLGIGLQLALGRVNHRQQHGQGFFVTFQPLVAHRQQVAILQVLLCRSPVCPWRARTELEQRFHQGGGSGILLAFDQRTGKHPPHVAAQTGSWQTAARNRQRRGPRQRNPSFAAPLEPCRGRPAETVPRRPTGWPVRRRTA